jgi:MFS family permease
MLGAGMALSGGGFLAAGLSQSAAQLTASLAIVGVGCSAYHPSGLALLTKGIRVRGRALGINGMWGNFGIASAPLVAGMLTYALGWQQALVVFGFIALLMGVMCLAVPLQIGSEDLQLATSVERGQVGTLFLLLCVVMVFSGLAYRSYTLILPTFFEVKLGGLGALLSGIAGSERISPDVDTLAATSIACGVYLVGMVGQLLGGRAADRFDLRWAYLLFFGAALPFLLGMRFAGGALLVSCAGAYVLFSFGMQPIENSLIAILTPARWRSIGYGIKFTLLFGAGSLAVQLVSMVKAGYGLDAVILLIAAFIAVVISMIALLVIRTRGTPIQHQS